MGRLDELKLIMDDLEAIKQRVNIVDLISEYLPLKKAGINFKVKCPFHSEKDPSFVVSPERQIWHCFSCGKGGDIFKFLMEKEGMEFKDALEFLAKRAGVTLKKSAPKKDFKDRLFEINLKTQEFYHFILTKHQYGLNAREYLTKRGVSDLTIEQFGIGYAPNSWESLSKFLLKRGFTSAELVAAGVAVESKNGCYDRFRARVTFPLIDTKDRIVGFSGRILDSEISLSGQSGPKYINTPQTPIFDKSNFLFGIQRSKGEMRAKNEAILVEGEMDAILSFQAGVKNIVASKGTALTAGQIELLKKYSENISLCFDTDLAGDSASRRGIEMAEAAGLNIKVIQFKDGKDPAEIINKDPTLWEKAVKEALPIYDYYLESAQKRYNLEDPAHIKKASGELIPIWVKIPDDLVRDHYIQKLAALLKMEEGLLRELVNQQRRLQFKPVSYSQVLKAGKDDSIQARSRREILEEYLVALLLHIPKDHTFTKFPIETIFISETLRQIYVLLVLYLDSISFKARSFNINEFSSWIPKELTEEIDRLYLTELDSKLENKLAWQKEVDGVIGELKKLLIKASLEKLSLEIKNAQAFGKIEAMETLNKRFRDLSVKLKNL